MLDEGGDVARVGTVDAEGNDLRVLVEHREEVNEGGAVIEVVGVLAGEAEPSGEVGGGGEELAEGVGFVAVGDCFAGEDVGLGGGEEVPTVIVELEKVLAGLVIEAGIFGAIGEVGGIGADAGGDEGAVAAEAVRFFAPKHITCFLRQSDSTGDEMLGIFGRVAHLHKAGDGGLVAGGDEAIGTGAEVSKVDVADGGWLLVEEVGGP